jgi:hypothetical protein
MTTPTALAPPTTVPNKAAPATIVTIRALLRPELEKPNGGLLMRDIADLPAVKPCPRRRTTS